MSLVSAATLLVCMISTCVNSHSTKVPSPAKSPVALTIDRRQSSPRSRNKNFQTMVPFYLQSPSLSVSSARTDSHYQWWDTGSSPELVESGWYGFNNFVPRSARNLGSGSSRKARTAYLLGESTQVQPQTNFKAPSRHQSNFETPSRYQSNFEMPSRYQPNFETSSRHQPNFETSSRHQSNFETSSRHRPNFETASRHQTEQYDEDYAIQEALRELQRNIRPLPQQDGYLEPRVIMIEEAVGLPPGILVPVAPPHRHQNSFQQRQHSYHRPQKDIRRLASAPTPVTIKVVPLKITSMDIAHALKMMPFMPIPLDLFQENERGDEGNYNDKESSEDESDLPPPSSHVATPLDTPLGITYADAQRTEHYISKHQPRK